MVGSLLVQLSAGVMVLPLASLTVAKAGFTKPCGAWRGRFIVTETVVPVGGGEPAALQMPKVLWPSAQLLKASRWIEMPSGALFSEATMSTEVRPAAGPLTAVKVP